jgi:hypothetical protein
MQSMREEFQLAYEALVHKLSKVYSPSLPSGGTLVSK